MLPESLISSSYKDVTDSCNSCWTGRFREKYFDIVRFILTFMALNKDIDYG